MQHKNCNGKLDFGYCGSCYDPRVFCSCGKDWIIGFKSIHSKREELDYTEQELEEICKKFPGQWA